MPVQGYADSGIGGQATCSDSRWPHSRRRLGNGPRRNGGTLAPRHPLAESQDRLGRCRPTQPKWRHERALGDVSGTRPPAGAKESRRASRPPSSARRPNQSRPALAGLANPESGITSPRRGSQPPMRAWTPLPRIEPTKGDCAPTSGVSSAAYPGVATAESVKAP
jgi:hypothetical protein